MGAPRGSIIVAGGGIGGISAAMGLANKGMKSLSWSRRRSSAKLARAFRSVRMRSTQWIISASVTPDAPRRFMSTS